MRNHPIPKLAAHWPEPNNGPMSYNAWMEQRTAFANALIAALPGPVNTNLPFEVHPYTHYQGQMPRNPKCYIIGTAPPASYLRSKVQGHDGMYPGPIVINGDQVGSAPNMLFYHGNVNSFWQAIGFPVITVEGILAQLNQRNIRYDDILHSWSRPRISSSNDQDLKDIVANVPLLEDVWSRTDSPYLWFTNSGVFNQSGIPIHNNANANGGPGRVMAHNMNMKAYNVFLRAWQELGAEVYVREVGNHHWIQIHAGNAVVLGGFNYKMQHELRIEFNGENPSGLQGVRSYPVLTGPSPARQAGLQMAQNPLYQAWSEGLAVVPANPTNAFRNHVYNQFFDWIAAHPAQ